MNKMIDDHEISIIVRSAKTGEILKETSVPAHSARVTVFLDDVAANGECIECGGTGDNHTNPDDTSTDCPACGGTGKA
jgi:DnaJ-class molecular chaperone